MRRGNCKIYLVENLFEHGDIGILEPTFDFLILEHHFRIVFLWEERRWISVTTGKRKRRRGKRRKKKNLRHISLHHLRQLEDESELHSCQDR